MYGYIKGTVKEITSSYIIIDNHDIGYLIYVPNPYGYQMEKEYTIYTYTNVREDEYTLYGFSSKEDKELFLKLISVKGLGPKMALPMFDTNNCKLLEEAIEEGNINYLKKFPKIGDKVARQVILDLKGKLDTGPHFTKKDNNELVSALTSLGYKTVDINRVIKKVDTSRELDDQIKEALKLLLK